MQTLLLNRGYEPLLVIPAQRAFVLMMQGKAEQVLPYEDKFFLHPEPIQVPSIIRLKRRVDFKTKKSKPTRRSILLRDAYTCAYCGCALDANTATLDHIQPKSRGGKNTWSNLVSSCKDCNNEKADRTPEEAGMELKYHRGFMPSVWQDSASHPDWEPFLKAYKRDEPLLSL